MGVGDNQSIGLIGRGLYICRPGNIATLREKYHVGQETVGAIGHPEHKRGAGRAGSIGRNIIESSTAENHKWYCSRNRN